MPSLVDNDDSNLVDDKAFESLLIDTFVPYTITRTTDSQGGSTKGWVAGTAFEGRLSRLSVSERMAQDKKTAIATHKIYCLTDVDLDPDDHVMLGAREFEVVGVQRPSNLMTEGHLEIEVREIDYDL